MAAVYSRFLLEGWIFILMGAFQRKRRRERQRTHKFWVREIFQKREFRYFAVGNAVHPGIVAVDPVIAIRSLESGFHMIAVITTIAEIELRSISAIRLSLRSLESGFHMTATIAEFFFCDRSDHVETRLKPPGGLMTTFKVTRHVITTILLYSSFYSAICDRN